MTILVEVVDPDGRHVELTDERWQHILVDPDGHPELAGYQAEVMQAIQTPDERRPGRRSNEQWFFLRNAGPSRWLQVVVAYDHDRGWIVTAFGMVQRPMSVQIGNLTFDRVRYDRDGDVLYLHRADPKDAVDFDASPEGHALRFNAAGKLIGVTILNARWLLEHEGKITITITERLEVEAAALGGALTAV